MPQRGGERDESDRDVRPEVPLRKEGTHSLQLGISEPALASATTREISSSYFIVFCVEVLTHLLG